MTLFALPNWVITFYHEDSFGTRTPIELVVPHDDLESMVRVVRASGINSFSVVQEKSENIRSIA